MFECPVNRTFECANPEYGNMSIGHYHSSFSETLQNMIIPIRCFSCGKVIGNKWEAYLGLLQVNNAISTIS